MQKLQNELHIGFTGHRPTKLGGYNIDTQEYRNLKNDLANYILEKLLTHERVICHSGLALGGDTIWSQAIFQMKEHYPERILFHAEIPMLEQANPWFKEADINCWHYQVDNADFKTIYGSLDGLSDNERRSMSGRFLNIRNEGMVDNSDIMLALHDGSAGGTNNARKYAEKTNKQVILINPKNYFA